MFLLLSEGFGICDCHILDDPEGTRIADAIWSELVYLFESGDSDMRREEWTLHIEDFFREIGCIMSSRDRFPHCLLELWYPTRLDRESRSLTMSTISDEKMLAFIQELDQIAPFWGTT